MASAVPFPPKPRQTPRGVAEVFKAAAAATVKTLSSAFVPHFTYSGNVHVFDAVSDCLNRLDFGDLVYQCSNGVPAELRPYVWFALLLRPTDPWHIRNLYVPKLGTRYRAFLDLVDAPNDVLERANYTPVDDRTRRTIDCDIVRTFPEGAQYVLHDNPALQRLFHRVLFLFSTFSKNGYFQGLNDILSMLLLAYLEPHALNGVFVVPPEAVLFRIEVACFFSLVSIFRTLTRELGPAFHPDTFTTRLAGLVTNNYGSYFRQRTDLELIRQQTYRWFVCLFCREFDYRLVFPIWDILFASKNLATLPPYLAVAFLLDIAGGCSLTALESFDRETKRFFSSMTEDKLCDLILSALELRENRVYNQDSY